MILALLGTQDRPFPRLLATIEKGIEDGIIADEVVIQAGHTAYKPKTEQMKMLTYLSSDEYENLASEADLIIAHGGVSAIFDGLYQGKTVIAAPRLQKYKEHLNDHQLQIVSVLEKEGYILALYENSDLGTVLQAATDFKPKQYISQTENVLHLIKEFIDKD
jgi:UDP-N-acetylglucosamine transferase subunit ALG13